MATTKSLLACEVCLPFVDVKGLWHEVKNLRELPLEGWDRLFRLGIKDEQGVESRQYVLQPVDGKGMYVRRAQKVDGQLETPYQDICLDWEDFALCFSQNQYRNVTMLLQELNRHQVLPTVLRY